MDSHEVRRAAKIRRAQESGDQVGYGGLRNCGEQWVYGEK